MLNQSTEQISYRNVGVVAKLNKPQAVELAGRVILFLQQRGLTCFVSTDLGVAISSEFIADLEICERHELTARCDLVVVLGGDGTLISVARHPAEHLPPIIGVNLGTLGFLTEIGQDELFLEIEKVLSGQAPIEERMLLAVSVYSHEREVLRTFALNDVVLTKDTLARIFGVEVKVNGEYAAILKGDGLIISTPCGSTAYSLAAGGSVVHPQVEALLVTPICPHSLTSRPLLIPSSFSVELSTPLANTESGSKEIYITVDGQEGMNIPVAGRVVITKASQKVRLVRSVAHSYFDMLRMKLKWGGLTACGE